jgi:hypothetical protein
VLLILTLHQSLVPLVVGFQVHKVVTVGQSKSNNVWI